MQASVTGTRASSFDAPMSPNQQAQLPKSWPAGVMYLRAPRYSASLTRQHLDAIQRPASESPPAVQPLVERPCPNVRIVPITDVQHPAHAQCGLFAARALPPNTLILYYLGLVHGPEDADPESDYDLCLEREHDIGVDATSCGNEARFINDYRGITSSGPNAEFRDCWVHAPSAKGLVLERRIGIYVLAAGKSGKRATGIAKNEEILVSYGKGFWANRA